MRKANVFRPEAAIPRMVRRYLPVVVTAKLVQLDCSLDCVFFGAADHVHKDELDNVPAALALEAPFAWLPR